MPILESDLKILKSEVFSDNLSGGGAATKAEVINGLSNNMFEDISTLDRVNGRVNLRKVFPSIETPNNDVGLGCHTIIAKIPEDTKQEVLLVSADAYSRRPAIISDVESYLNEGAIEQLFVYGTAFANSQSINLISSPLNANPDIGDVLILKSSATTDYFAVATIVTTLTTFINSNGNTYQRNVHAITARQAIKNSYVGVSNTEFFDANPATRVFASAVVNSTAYHSSKKTTTISAALASTIDVSDVFGQLVPSSRVDVPIISTQITTQGNKLLAASQSSHSRAAFSLTSTYTFGYGIAYGTLTIAGFTVSGSNVLSGVDIIATIDYLTGTFTKTGAASSYSFTCTFKVGAKQGSSMESFASKITINNRSTVYNFIAPNFISAGSLTVRYRSLKKWYTLRDNGAGQLVGVGSGNIFYDTKIISVSLAALPDVDSAIVIQYANNVGIQPVDLTGYTPKLHFARKLNNNTFTVSSLTITYTDTSNIVRTITTNTAGILGGDGVGEYSRESGVVAAVPTFTVKPATSVIFSYGERVPVTENFTNLPRNINGDLEISLTQTPIAAGSVSVEWDAELSVSVTTVVISGVSNRNLVPTGKSITPTTLSNASALGVLQGTFGIGDPSKSYGKGLSTGLGVTEAGAAGRGYIKHY